MLPYRLTQLAEEDMKDIARYTLKKWGKDQSMCYAGKLERCFRGIAAETVHSRSFSERYPQVKVCHCEHHYVFYICLPGDNQPVIIAVLHERMDMLVRLKSRLC